MLAGNRSDLGGGLHVVDVAARAVWQTTNPENARLSDLNKRELGLMLPLMFLMIFMGVYPRVFLDRSKASVDVLRARITATPAGGTYTTKNLNGKSE